MKNVYFTKEFLESDISEIWLPFYNLCEVEEGEDIATVTHKEIIEEEVIRYNIKFKEKHNRKSTIKSIGSGLFVGCTNGHLYGWDLEKFKEGDLFYSIYDDLADYVSNNDDKYEIAKDEFSGEKFIKWIAVGHLYYPDNYFNLSNFEVGLKFRFLNNLPVLSITFDNKYRKVKKGDSLSLLFNSGMVLKYTVLNKCHEPKDFRYGVDCRPKEVDLLLKKSDIDTMLNYDFLKLKFDFANGDPSIITRNETNKIKNKYRVVQFKKYVKNFCRALNELGFKWDESNSKKRKELIVKDKCYVYLMIDRTNGFHKIGISNKPQYREHTLQSEKPSIELICAKEFPSRKIAEALESALHKTYENKRVRGEWFDLSKEDISDLKCSLS